MFPSAVSHIPKHGQTRDTEKPNAYIRLTAISACVYIIEYRQSIITVCVIILYMPQYIYDKKGQEGNFLKSYFVIDKSNYKCIIQQQL